MYAKLCNVDATGHTGARKDFEIDANSSWASMALPELAALLGSPANPEALDSGVIFPVRRLKPGETLCRAGDEFAALYVVRSGFLKIVSVDPFGNEQVLSFPMRGDVIGLGSVEPGYYTADAIALDTCHVIAVSFERIASLAFRLPMLARLLYSVFSRELARRQNMIRLLGMLNAEARVAAFLLDLSDRFAQMGCSRSSFVLRMTREELGSYLGIKLETVSRALSAFAAAGLVAVDRRQVTLKDMEKLRAVLEPRPSHSGGAQPRHRQSSETVQPSLRIRRAVRETRVAA